MADTCIVCLGDLEAEGASTGKDETNGDLQASADVPVTVDDAVPSAASSEGFIAHLLPCGHELHNSCLKPWVERANSCPICRSLFFQVELKATVQGATISTYEVQSKKQEADLDISALVDDEPLESEDIPPCLVCDEYGDDAELLLCDGCSASCHIFCAGLDDAPHGDWFCYDCAEDPARLTAASRTSSSDSGPRSRPRRRRSGTRRGDSVAWRRVWQSVWHRLHVDLDFPFDHEPDDDNEWNRAAERSEVRQWQDRYRVAERQGAAHRFRDTAVVLLDSSAARGTTPNAGSMEELRAWNELDKAKDMQQGEASNSNRRKRKSVTSSPSEPSATAEAERKLKRPRTRRAHDLSDAAAEPATEPTAASSNMAIAHEDVASRPTLATPQVASSSANDRAESTPVAAAGSPSFIQALLKEVETKPTQNREGFSNDSPAPGRAMEGASSPNHSSRAASPVLSNLGSPLATTPTLSPTRPISPPPLSSIVSPIFPRAPEYSPYSPAEPDIRKSRSHHASPDAHHGVATHTRFRNISPQRPNGVHIPEEAASPTTTTGLSYSTKSEIQKLVSAILKPKYQQQLVNTDEYTDINRSVSRMLYEKISNASELADTTARDRLVKIAEEEVETAVKTLKANSNRQTT